MEIKSVSLPGGYALVIEGPQGNFPAPNQGDCSFQGRARANRGFAAAARVC